MTRCRKLAALCCIAGAALAGGVTDSFPRARAATDEAREASRGTAPEAGPADAGYVELRSELLDERERRIERRLEANGAALVVLAIVIGAGGLWLGARFTGESGSD